MFCIKCHNLTQVINSRPSKKNPSIWRRRRCSICKYTFTTREEIAFEDYILINGHTFNTFRLALSLMTVLPREDEQLQIAYWLSRTIGEQLIASKIFDTDRSTLLTITADVLKKYNPTAGTTYELKYRLITPSATARRGRPRLKR